MGLPFLGDLIKGATGIIDKFIVDPSEKLEAQTQMYQMLMNSDMAQMEVNKQEAAHKSLFVAGWRPAVGWTCAIGLFWGTIGQNILQWGMAIWAPTVVAPVIDTATLIPILMGMLGMGGLRTFEKMKKISREK